jgi:hypothetical protein
MGERPKITLTNPYPFAESVGVFGEQGSGKTRVTFEWANHCPDMQFTVFDLDVRKSYQRMLYLGYRHCVDQFDIIEMNTWSAFADRLEEVVNAAQAWSAAEALKHCLTIDTTTWVWEAAQAGYSLHVHEKGVEEYAMELRKASADAKEFARMKSEDGFWQDVTTLHRVRFYDQLTRWPGHLVLTAEAEAPSKQFAKDATSEEDKAMVTYGYKPRAQKRFPYVPKTLLLLQKVGRDRFEMTTIKDMEREQLERAPFESFATDYLMEVAGWTASVAAGAAKASAPAAKVAAGVAKKAPGRRV